MCVCVCVYVYVLPTSVRGPKGSAFYAFLLCKRSLITVLLFRSSPFTLPNPNDAIHQPGTLGYAVSKSDKKPLEYVIFER